MTSLSCHETPYDTHPEKVINDAKFDVCTSGSFGRDKKDKQKHRKTERIALYILHDCGQSNFSFTCCARKHGFLSKYFIKYFFFTTAQRSSN